MTPAQGVLPTLPFQSQAAVLPAPNLLAAADASTLPEGDLSTDLPPTGAGPAPVAPVGIQPAVMTVETTTSAAGGGSAGGAKGGARPMRAGFTVKPGSQVPVLPTLSTTAPLGGMSTEVAPSVQASLPSPTVDLPPAAQPQQPPSPQVTAPAQGGGLKEIGLLGGLGMMAGIGVLWASVRRIMGRRRDDQS